jgi:hypothetical protein
LLKILSLFFKSYHSLFSISGFIPGTMKLSLWASLALAVATVAVRTENIILAECKALDGSYAGAYHAAMLASNP